MRRGLQTDKSRMIIDRAVGEVRKGQRSETALATGLSEGDFASHAAEPIHDPDGVLYFMCGVSECGGSDVCGP